MANLRVVTVKSSGGDYSSIVAALTGESGDLVAANRLLRIDCHPFVDTSVAPSDGGYTTDATRYLTINAVSDHGGAWNASAYIFQPASFQLGLSSAYVRLTGVQIDVGAMNGVNLSSTTGTVERAIIRGTSASFVGAIISGRIISSVVYGCTTNIGIRLDATGVALNCTSAGNIINIAVTAPGATLINCLAQHNGVSGTDYSDAGGTTTFSAASGSNIASDASGQSAYVTHSKSVSFRGTNDYHLASTDTNAIGHGTNLRNDATYPVTDDIDGAERHGTWDVGADQYVAPTTWTLNDLAPLPLTETFSTPATAFSQRADIFPLGILLEAAATAVNVTGVAATANAPETSTLSSREVVTGSATSATAAETGSATGLERMLGTAATATAPETSTLASTEVITGSLTSADAPETTDAAGREVFTGAASTATAPETSTLASAEVISGSATTAEAAGTSALTGAEAMAGALASATAPETSTLASTEVITGSIASADAAQPTSATGQEVFVGSAATATAPETSTLASVEVVTGSVASATAAESSALTGAEAFTGAIGSATAPETSTLASTEVISGSATSADAAQSGDLAGAEVFVGAIDSATAAETTTLASTEVVTGAIASADDAQTSDLTGEITPPVDDGSSTGEITSAQDAQSSELTGAVANPEVIPPAPIGGGGIVRPRVPKKRGPHITVVAPPAVRTWVVPRARVVLGGHTAQPAPARTGWVVPSATMALGASVPAVQPARSQWIALAPAVLIAPDPDEEFLILSLADGLL